jgi:hypothetical protein
VEFQNLKPSDFGSRRDDGHCLGTLTLDPCLGKVTRWVKKVTMEESSCN